MGMWDVMSMWWRCTPTINAGWWYVITLDIWPSLTSGFCQHSTLWNKTHTHTPFIILPSSAIIMVTVTLTVACTLFYFILLVLHCFKCFYWAVVTTKHMSISATVYMAWISLTNPEDWSRPKRYSTSLCTLALNHFRSFSNLESHPL